MAPVIDVIARIDRHFRVQGLIQQRLGDGFLHDGPSMPDQWRKLEEVFTGRRDNIALDIYRFQIVDDPGVGQAFGLLVSRCATPPFMPREWQQPFAEVRTRRIKYHMFERQRRTIDRCSTFPEHCELFQHSHNRTGLFTRTGH